MAIREFIGADHIAQRITAMAAEIAAAIPAEARDEGLVLVGPLKGAVMLVADLARALHPLLPRVELDFIGLSSYHGGTSSSGQITLSSVPRGPLAGRHVLLVDDIVDTGRTLHYAQDWLARADVASQRTAVLLDKPARRVVQVPVDHVGFEIEDVFVVGYGTDFAERYRALPYIGIWSPGE